MSVAKRGFKTFDHTADVGLEVWAEKLESLFEEAALGLFNLMADVKQVVPREEMKIKLSAENREELFMVWLKELLYIFDTKKILLSNFQIMSLNPKSLTAKVSGEKLDSAKHQLGREVKAVTYHLFELKQTNSGFVARVIVDI